MLKTKKKSVTIVLVLVLLIALCGQSLAAENGSAAAASGIVTPQWVNTDVVSVNLAFAGGKATCSAYVIAKAGTSQITATAVLERFDSTGTYTPVNTWGNLNAYSNYLNFSGTYYVATGYTYRLSFTATVYRSGTSETITAYSSAYAG